MGLVIKDYKKFKASFGYAWRGFTTLIKTEQNARFHLFVGTIVGISAIVLKISRIEKAVLFMAVVLVFAIEIMNTAIEKLLDIVHPDNHATIRYVKDAMAGAVLITASIAAVVGLLVFYPHFKLLFR